MMSFERGCICLEDGTQKLKTRALDSLDDVLSWNPSEDQLLQSISSNTDRFTRSTNASSRPCTIVCHDFKGGYLQDRYLQGGKKEDAYYFVHWDMVDMFVYFSHHFVTVPPLGWTRAAHKHGTLILGTLITEWEEGVSLWERVLASRSTMLNLVHRLVDLCKCYAFDGWLVNIENKIEEGEVHKVVEFVHLLREESHKQLPGSKVLWYDSITTNGALDWQNALNINNSMFFDVSDGIFLNYCWTEESLAISKAAAEEKGRPFDVFVGIDVFGRGCPGGGGFQTREALQAVRKLNLSAAIFAPGWVLETLPDGDHFHKNDIRFWGELCDLCPADSSAPLPFSSAFCQGHGDAFFIMGKAVADQPWYNLSLQQRQPHWTLISEPGQGDCSQFMSPCLSQAYCGGSSLCLSASLKKPFQPAVFRLFRIQGALGKRLYCSYICSGAEAAACQHYLLLTFDCGPVMSTVVLGSSQHLPAQLESHLTTAAPLLEVKPGCQQHGPQRKVLYVRQMKPGERQGLECSVWLNQGHQQHADLPWKTRYFEVDSSQLCSVVGGDGEVRFSVAACLVAPGEEDWCSGTTQAPWHSERVIHASFLLGHLQIFREEDLKFPVPIVTNIRVEQLPNVVDQADQAFSMETIKATITRCEQESDQMAEIDNELGTHSSSVWSKDCDSIVATTTDDAECSSGSPMCVVQWDMKELASVDYFNIYLSTTDSPRLVGQTVLPLFVTQMHQEFVQQDRVTVTVQPVLSATSLPLPLFECSSITVPWP